MFFNSVARYQNVIVLPVLLNISHIQKKYFRQQHNYPIQNNTSLFDISIQGKSYDKATSESIQDNRRLLTLERMEINTDFKQKSILIPDEGESQINTNFLSSKSERAVNLDRLMVSMTIVLQLICLGSECERPIFNKINSTVN